MSGIGHSFASGMEQKQTDFGEFELDTLPTGVLTKIQKAFNRSFTHLVNKGGTSCFLFQLANMLNTHTYVTGCLYFLLVNVPLPLHTPTPPPQ